MPDNYRIKFHLPKYFSYIEVKKIYQIEKLLSKFFFHGTNEISVSMVNGSFSKIRISYTTWHKGRPHLTKKGQKLTYTPSHYLWLVKALWIHLCTLIITLFKWAIDSILSLSLEGKFISFNHIKAVNFESSCYYTLKWTWQLINICC